MKASRILLICFLLTASAVAEAQNISFEYVKKKPTVKKLKQKNPVPIVPKYGDNLETGNCGPRRSQAITSNPVDVNVADDYSTLYIETMGTTLDIYYELCDASENVYEAGVVDTTHNSFEIDLTNYNLPIYIIRLTIEDEEYEGYIFVE